MLPSVHPPAASVVLRQRGLRVSAGDVISLFTETAEMDGHLRADGFADNMVTVALSPVGVLPNHFEECLFQVCPRLTYRRAKAGADSLAGAGPTFVSAEEVEDKMVEGRNGRTSPRFGESTTFEADEDLSGAKFSNPAFEIEDGAEGSPVDGEQQWESLPNPDSARAAAAAAADRELATSLVTNSVKDATLNVETERQHMGTAVKFGSFIQLRHVKSGGAPSTSRWRDCHFADTSLFVPVEIPTKGGGGCSRMTASPTATLHPPTVHVCQIVVCTTG